jgi:hypothetical protein
MKVRFIFLAVLVALAVAAILPVVAMAGPHDGAQI